MGTSAAMTDIPLVPSSWGEVIDKITILEIKVARLPTETARANAARELKPAAAPSPHPVTAQTEIAGLDGAAQGFERDTMGDRGRIRAHERAANFDAAFIALARSVYHRNDERGAVKRGAQSASWAPALIEEKSYEPY